MGWRRRKESLRGRKFRENHPEMSCRLLPGILLCQHRRNSVRSGLLSKKP